MGGQQEAAAEGRGVGNTFCPRCGSAARSSGCRAALRARRAHPDVPCTGQPWAEIHIVVIIIAILVVMVISFLHTCKSNVLGIETKEITVLWNLIDTPLPVCCSCHFTITNLTKTSYLVPAEGKHHYQHDGATTKLPRGRAVFKLNCYSILAYSVLHVDKNIIFFVQSDQYRSSHMFTISTTCKLDLSYFSPTA